MKRRKLRIAWSIGCGIACALLIVLWILSYDYLGCFTGDMGTTRSFILESYRGRLLFTLYSFHNEAGTGFAVQPINEVFVAMYDVRPSEHWFGFGAEQQTKGGLNFFYASVPHLFAIVIAATLAAAPQFQYRFSLRMLLLVITAAAVIFGTAIMAVRS